MLQTMSSDNIGFWYAEEDGNAFEDALIALMKPTMNYANVQVGDSLKLKAARRRSYWRVIKAFIPFIYGRSAIYGK